jgi:cytochrome b involved in lipid metabolism/ferredoxin-NADP reductase
MVSNREQDVLAANNAVTSGPLGLESVQQSRAVRERVRAPSELALTRLELSNARRGHENAGFLSVQRGYVPTRRPLLRLDARFSVWDELAADLPTLYRTLQLRRRVEQLPVLDASADSLDEAEVLRACALLAIAAHAYWYVDSRPPRGALPQALARPWAQLRERLGRTQEVITYIDLIVYNWRVRDESRADPLVVENLELLFPTIGNQEERVFYLTQLEILARTSPVVGLVAAAQGAVLRQDDDALEASLVGIIDCLEGVVARALPKINPNPHGSTHVDPVAWAKTVAPFAVPLHAGDQGPSGTSSPLFNTLDLFFGRKDYASFLGREIQQLRHHYPRAWQVYLSSLTEVSVARYIEERGSRALRSAFRQAFELYAGDSGFLGRHRMKVYGYLELAFKVGRSVTIGGFGGVFTDRTWDVVDRELSASQAERVRTLPHFVQHARVVNTVSASDAPSGLQRVTLDVSRAGVRYHGGDRCLILPENDPLVVERTLEALELSGEQRVGLTDEWQAYARDRVELAGLTQISARDLLRYGAIRPVSPRLAEALHARTQSVFLLDAIVRGCTERWELWELLALLRARGYAPSALWQQPGLAVSEQLSRLIPPQRFRVYSVSSAPAGARRRAEHSLQLTVGQLSYPAPRPEPMHLRATEGGCPMGAHPTPAPRGEPSTGGCPMRFGTASAFLTRAQEQKREVPFRIQQSDVFRLPDDPSTPIVMFAGGSGVAPFRAFVQERARRSHGGQALLFLSVRSPDDLLYADELGRSVLEGRLQLEVAFTRVGARMVLGEDGKIALCPAPTQRLPELMLTPRNREQLWRMSLPREAGGAGAVFYVCGRSGLADTVLTTLKQIFHERLRARGSAHAQEQAASLLYRMVGDRRLLQELHTDASPREEVPRLLDMSEIAQHNDAQRGYWIVVDGVVYDLTEFIELHPGGRRAVQAYAGMDATHGYTRAHHGRADVDAMRDGYRIGRVRTLRFDDHLVRIEGPAGSVAVDASVAYRSFERAVALVVEMQNALAADQSLRVGPDAASASSAYRLQRGVETHRRFLLSYFAVLLSDTLPGLWRVGQGLFFPSQSADWMQTTLSRMRSAGAGERTEAISLRAFERFESWHEAGTLAELVHSWERLDAWCLSELKHALLLALREFERHELRVRQCGALRLARACQRLAGVVRQYYRRSAREALQVVRDSPLEEPVAGATVELACPRPQGTRRLHAGTYWILEESLEQQLVVLRRTPIAATSLAALSEENEHVLRRLLPQHRSFGLVVDMRQARLRNDRGFEDAMAKLRREVTSHFQRTAVLLESSIGELQVTRIERDERRNAIATRSESTAFKFAQGGA